MELAKEMKRTRNGKLIFIINTTDYMYKIDNLIRSVNLSQFEQQECLENGMILQIYFA